mmetsp:Transcript_59888/g.159438  ORF Transcript_59888/g.159438 Transcript_59888/m.159438 type:complete len:190 (-) Transcript_59888:194-763(-)
MTIATVVASRRQEQRAMESEKRKQMQRTQKSHFRRASRVMAAYDRDRSGKLSEEEIRSLLTDLVDGDVVSEDEVSYIMALGDPTQSGQVPLQAVCDVITTFKTYLSLKPELDLLFDKYDLDGSGSLDKHEIRQLLADITEGKVSDEDVAWVMMQADVHRDELIVKPELLHAIAAWYAKLDERKSCCCLS